MSAVQTLKFVKYHGLGNDFIVVDTDAPRQWSAEQARTLCERHRGVGADGVLLVGPGIAGSRASMRVLNADGSEPEMCGNGLRCVALHLAILDETNHTSFDVATGAGTLGCDVTRDGLQASVRIAMGQAKVGPTLSFEAEGRELLFDRVTTGNPHAISFDGVFDTLAIDRIAPRVSAAIPGGSNVEFVEQASRQRLRLIVWERGVGRTLACGTGAVASVVAAAVRERVPFDSPVTVELAGGELRIEVSEAMRAYLEGPAVRVFTGELPL
jgi:diaminopimelate epimerase